MTFIDAPKDPGDDQGSAIRFRTGFIRLNRVEAQLSQQNVDIEDRTILANQLSSGVKYQIYDVAEFKIDPRTVHPLDAGAVDQTLVREVAARGGPLYRSR